MATEFNIQPPRWEVIEQVQDWDPIWLVQRTDDLGNVRKALLSRTSVSAEYYRRDDAFNRQILDRADGLRFIGEVSRHPRLMTYTDQWAVRRSTGEFKYCDYYLMTDALPTLAQVCRDRANKQPELIRLDSDPAVAAQQLEQYRASLRPSDEELLRLGTQIYEALKVCYKHELVAVPVTPDNIYVDEDGNFLLGDLISMSGDANSGFENLGRVMYRLLEGHDPEDGQNIPRHCDHILATFVHSALTDSLNDDLIAILTNMTEPDAQAGKSASTEANTDSNETAHQETASQLVSVLTKIQEQKDAAEVPPMPNLSPAELEAMIREKAAMNKSIAAGLGVSVCLTQKGTVLARRKHLQGVAKWRSTQAVATGISFALGLRTNGTVQVASFDGKTMRNAENWTNITAIAAADTHAVGLRADGTVVITTDNPQGQRTEELGWKNIAAVCTGITDTFGLRTNGTVVATDHNSRVCHWSNIVAIAAGFDHVVGLLPNGTVIAACNENGHGQPSDPEACDVGQWRDIVAIAAANHHTIGLKADGTVVAAGYNMFGACNVENWKDIVAISTCPHFTMGLKADGTLVCTDMEDSSPNNDMLPGKEWKSILLPGQTPTYVFEVMRKPAPKPSSDCRVLVFARGKAAEAALAAGADYVGGADLAQKIRDEGWYDFDVVIAAPDMMGIVGRLGALLDALGLFPSITGGTITPDVAAAVHKYKNTPYHKDTSVTQPPAKPEQPKHRVSLAVGCEHIVGLRKDGTLITAGETDYDQCDVSGWKQIISIDCGNFFTVGLKEDGTMVTAGSAFYDPNNFAEWNHLQAVAAGGNHLVALKEDGSVLAVGDNRQAQCNVAGWQQIRSVAAGDHHTLGVMHDGTVVATGGNRFGECNILKWNRIKALSAGEFHTVGLKEDGTVTAIGNDVYGQCRTDGWKRITAIAAGSYHTVGLRDDGTVVAVGDNEMGQCHVRNWKNIVAIAANGTVTLGLRNDGTVLCTEADYDLSDWNDILLPGQEPVAPAKPVKTIRKKPDPVPGPNCRVLVFARDKAAQAALAAGADYAGAEDLAQKIQDEGWDEFDVVIAHPHVMSIVGKLARPLCDMGLMPSPKLGTVTTDVAAAVRKYKGLTEPVKEEPKKPVVTPVSIPKPPIKPVPLSIRAQIRHNAMMKAVIAAGRNHSVALGTDGSVKAVGSNQYGQCSANGWKGMTAVAAGGNHTVALRTNGRVLASGNNQHNQCSVVNWINITQIAAGEAHTVGLKADGTVMAIGSQDSGQCNVMGWRNVGAIAAGAKHTVALQLDGTVLATGSKASHQCDVGEWKNIVSIAAGDWHTVGLRADGTVVAVGNNISGQCRVQNWSGIIAIAAGTSHTIGLKKDGTVVSAGNCRTVDGWRNIIAIAAGGNHSLGLRADGSVLATGMNQNKECAVQDWKNICVPASEADNRTNDYTDLIRMKVEAASSIAASSDHAAFLTDDGRVHCVGKNQFSQCNTGTWKTIKAVAVGDSHTVGLKEDGTVMATGKNITGQCNVSLWHHITQISASGDRTIGLRSNGTVAAAGIPTDSEEYKAIAAWRNIVAVIAGYSYTFGLKADGTLAVAGSANAGQCDVADWKNIISVSAGLSITVGLRADGTVVTAGKPPIRINGTDVSGWREIDAVIADGYNVIGIRKDGTVICTGDTGMNPTKKAVSEWHQVVAIARGNLQIIGLNTEGKLLVASVGAKQTYDVSKLPTVRVFGEAKNTSGDVFWHRASLI